MLPLCAIARKSRLSPKPKGIAIQLSRVLNQAMKAKEYEARFEIVDNLKSALEQFRAIYEGVEEKEELLS